MCVIYYNVKKFLSMCACVVHIVLFCGQVVRVRVYIVCKYVCKYVNIYIDVCMYVCIYACV